MSCSYRRFRGSEPWYFSEELWHSVSKWCAGWYWTSFQWNISSKRSLRCCRLWWGSAGCSSSCNPECNLQCYRRTYHTCSCPSWKGSCSIKGTWEITVSIILSCDIIRGDGRLSPLWKWKEYRVMTYIQERGSTHVYHVNRMSKEEMDHMISLCVHEQPAYCVAA